MQYNNNQTKAQNAVQRNNKSYVQGARTICYNNTITIKGTQYSAIQYNKTLTKAQNIEQGNNKYYIQGARLICYYTI